MSPLRAEFVKKLELRGLATGTVSLYVEAVNRLSKFYGRSPIGLTKQNIENYLSHQINVLKLNPSSINVQIVAFQSFYKLMDPENKAMQDIKKMKTAKKLPVILELDDIEKLFDRIPNIRQKAAAILLYSAGLRLSECMSLRVTDIISKRMMIRVRQGKGKKDRYTVLSKRALFYLRFYFKKYQPKIWLFEGPHGRPISKRLIARTLSIAAQRAGIRKNVRPHDLRHSFATHLMESGVQIQVIQKLLGHASIRTTTIYTHVSKTLVDNLINPFDGDNKGEVLHAS